jgi:hypothetical protein
MHEVFSNVNFSSEFKKCVSFLSYNPSCTFLTEFLYIVTFLKSTGLFFPALDSRSNCRVTPNLRFLSEAVDFNTTPWEILNGGSVPLRLLTWNQ